MQNLEYKCELRDPGLARGILKALKATPIIQLEQEDTYFRLPDGRLFRRVARNEPVEWIFYHRPNGIGPRLSTFTILTERQARTRWGTEGLEPWLTIRKQRDLWMVENVAVCLDDVAGLGSFIEFTALLAAGDDEPRSKRRLMRLRERMAPTLGESISRAYSDLAAEELRRCAS